MVARRPAPHRLRRGEPDVAVERRLLGHRRDGHGHHQRPDVHRARCRSACRACGSTPSRSASPARSRRCGAPGSPSPPRPGTWRMRQVINKLIREEDLYGAVESAFSQGWRRVKLYFLTGLPTETDEDTLGIAELARQLRRHRAQPPPRRARSTASVGRLRAQAPDPVPVVRAGHRRRAAAQDQPAARRDARRQGRPAALARPEGDPGRGHRQPRRSPDRGRHRGRCGAGAAPSRSGRSTSTLDCGPTPWPRHGLSIDWYVHRHRDRDEVLPWAHISAGLHEDFLWQDWQRRPGRARVRRTAAGRRATTAGPAPATASSTWWRRRPAGRGQPGHRQDLAGGASGARRPRLATGGRGDAAMTRVRIRFAKLGKIRWTSHRDMARMWERAFRRVELPLAYSAGLLPAAQGQLRAGPAHRPRVRGRVPGRRAGRPGADVDVAALPAGCRPPFPPGSTPPPPRSSAPGPVAAGRGHACTWRLCGRPRGSGLDRSTVDDLAPGSSACSPPPLSSSPESERGRRSPTTSVPPSSRVRVLDEADPSQGVWLECRAGHPAPLACGRRSCWPPSAPISTSATCGGPINGSCATAPVGATCGPARARRTRRTPWSVRHEKGLLHVRPRDRPPGRPGPAITWP